MTWFLLLVGCGLTRPELVVSDTADTAIVWAAPGSGTTSAPTTSRSRAPVRRWRLRDGGEVCR